MEIGGHVTPEAFIAVVDGGPRFRLSSAARARIMGARAVVDRHAAGSAPVYGLNTGLGGNLAHRLQPHEMAAFQAQLLRGRSVGVGPPLPPRIGRAALLARLIGAAAGHAGLSMPVVDLMLDMLNAGLAPVIPTHGSIGAGDLVLGAHVGAALIGEGEVWSEGRRRPAADALCEAGLAPVDLAPKDALALANHSAVTTALAADVFVRARTLLLLAQAAAALAGEGYAMNLTVFDAAVNAARPAPGQAATAAWFRTAFKGSSLLEGPARAIQDALSFRTLAPVFGAAAVELERLGEAVTIELNAGGDNPAVLGDAVLSTANFHTSALATALDAAAVGIAQAATAGAGRVIKLMTPGFSGLPKYLSPAGGASAGFVPMQKTLAALLGEVHRHAAPVSLYAMPVSETVEDVAPQTPLAARKLGQGLDAWRLLVGVEAMVAAQAIDLRTPKALGAAGRALFDRVRAAVPALDEDRATGPDVEAVLRAIETPELVGLLADF